MHDKANTTVERVSDRRPDGTRKALHPYVLQTRTRVRDIA